MAAQALKEYFVMGTSESPTCFRGLFLTKQQNMIRVGYQSLDSGTWRQSVSWNLYGTVSVKFTLPCKVSILTERLKDETHKT